MPVSSMTMTITNTMFSSEGTLLLIRECLRFAWRWLCWRKWLRNQGLIEYAKRDCLFGLPYVQLLDFEWCELNKVSMDLITTYVAEIMSTESESDRVLAVNREKRDDEVNFLTAVTYRYRRTVDGQVSSDSETFVHESILDLIQVCAQISGKSGNNVDTGGNSEHDTIMNGRRRLDTTVNIDALRSRLSQLSYCPSTNSIINEDNSNNSSTKGNMYNDQWTFDYILRRFNDNWINIILQALSNCIVVPVENSTGDSGNWLHSCDGQFPRDTLILLPITMIMVAEEEETGSIVTALSSSTAQTLMYLCINDDSNPLLNQNNYSDNYTGNCGWSWYEVYMSSTSYGTSNDEEFAPMYMGTYVPTENEEINYITSLSDQLKMWKTLFVSRNQMRTLLSDINYPFLTFGGNDDLTLLKKCQGEKCWRIFLNRILFPEYPLGITRSWAIDSMTQKSENNTNDNSVRLQTVLNDEKILLSLLPFRCVALYALKCSSNAKNVTGGNSGNNSNSNITDNVTSGMHQFDYFSVNPFEYTNALTEATMNLFACSSMAPQQPQQQEQQKPQDNQLAQSHIIGVREKKHVYSVLSNSVNDHRIHCTFSWYCDEETPIIPLESLISFTASVTRDDDTSAADDGDVFTSPSYEISRTNRGDFILVCTNVIIMKKFLHDVLVGATVIHEDGSVYLRHHGYAGLGFVLLPADRVPIFDRSIRIDDDNLFQCCGVFASNRDNNDNDDTEGLRFCLILSHENLSDNQYRQHQLSQRQRSYSRTYHDISKFTSSSTIRTLLQDFMAYMVERQQQMQGPGCNMTISGGGNNNDESVVAAREVVIANVHIDPFFARAVQSQDKQTIFSYVNLLQSLIVRKFSFPFSPPTPSSFSSFMSSSTFSSATVSTNVTTTSTFNSSLSMGFYVHRFTGGSCRIYNIVNTLRANVAFVRSNPAYYCPYLVHLGICNRSRGISPLFDLSNEYTWKKYVCFSETMSEDRNSSNNSSNNSNNNSTNIVKLAPLPLLIIHSSTRDKRSMEWIVYEFTDRSMFVRVYDALRIHGKLGPTVHFVPWHSCTSITEESLVKVLGKRAYLVNGVLGICENPVKFVRCHDYCLSLGTQGEKEEEKIHVTAASALLPVETEMMVDHRLFNSAISFDNFANNFVQESILNNYGDAIDDFVLKYVANTIDCSNSSENVRSSSNINNINNNINDNKKSSYDQKHIPTEHFYNVVYRTLVRCIGKTCHSLRDARNPNTRQCRTIVRLRKSGDFYVVSIVCKENQQKVVYSNIWFPCINLVRSLAQSIWRNNFGKMTIEQVVSRNGFVDVSAVCFDDGVICYGDAPRHIVPLIDYYVRRAAMRLVITKIQQYNSSTKVTCT